MPDKSEKPNPERPSAKSNLLEELLGSVEKFLTVVSEEAIASAPEGELKILISSTSESLLEQNKKLVSHIRESANRLSGVQRLELESFLSVQDGAGMAKRGYETSQRLMKAGLVKKLIRWIAQNFRELKKILKEIMMLIFDLLHIKWPSWLDRIFQILDEILDLLLSLLGEVFGIDFGISARQLSEGEVNYLRELATFEMLRAAQSGIGERGDDEG